MSKYEIQENDSRSSQPSLVGNSKFEAICIRIARLSPPFPKQINVYSP